MRSRALLDAEQLVAARELSWIASAYAAWWGALLVGLAGLGVTSASSTVRAALEELWRSPVWGPIPTVMVVGSMVATALLSMFNQQLRIELGSVTTRSPSGVAFWSVFVPFLVSGVVGSRLDEALGALEPPAPRTRGGALGFAPLALLLVAIAGELTNTDALVWAAIGGLCASRLAWGLLTVRACRALRLRAPLEGARAHGAAPVAGG